MQNHMSLRTMYHSRDIWEQAQRAKVQAVQATCKQAVSMCQCLLVS